MSKEVCIHLSCEETTNNSLELCDFHSKGGVFNSGETYDLYQIIEQDFINFIKIVPINDPEHLKVHSPILQDIIIRSCVQIEFFFKEWAKFEYRQFPNSSLVKKFNKIDKKTKKPKGARNWNFPDYFPFVESQLQNKKIYVRALENYIQPFAKWSKPELRPDWWNVYNGIKHDGINTKKEANLEMALYALAGLFLLHCSNEFSKQYLEQFVTNRVIKKGGKFILEYGELATPVDSKKYLFKEFNNLPKRTNTISMDQNLIDRVSFKGRSV